MFKCCYHEYCTQGGTVVGKGERIAPAQRYDWNSSGADGDVAETADEMEGEN